MSRRVAVAFVVPVGVYAVLLVVALVGGPRAPVIPLPGGGAGVEAAQPVTGPPPPGAAGETLPAIPQEVTPTPSSPLSTGPLDENGQPGQPPATGRPGGGRPSAATSLPSEPPTSEPTPGVAERRNPSMPPATKTPPAPPRTEPTDPGQPPSSPGTPNPPPTVTPTATPSGPPDQPKPPTLADTLLVLLGKLRR